MPPPLAPPTVGAETPSSAQQTAT